VWLNTIMQRFHIPTAICEIPMQGSLTEVVAAAISGSVVSFPTDTIPALAVRPDRAELIYQLKQRDVSKPLILLAANSADLWPFAQGSSEEKEIWQKMANRYWPGALTLVLPASTKVPKELNIGHSTIGLRLPNSEPARAVLQQTGALATSSANLSGTDPILSMLQIDRVFSTVTTLIGERDRSLINQPSTVIKWTGNGWEVLRQGSIMVN
jgi:L-threonylcarbamoyladenylate synthase